jgi:hypothetical protein
MKKLIIPAILAILFFLSSYRLFRPGYFSMQDNMHVFRLSQFDQCLRDHQIPCRYIPDGGLGYGYPLFNYYSPLPYAYAETFHLLGLSYIDSIKLVFITGFLLSLIGFYLFCRIYFNPSASLVGASFYLFAPYRAVDAYVRGALAEFFALSLVPFVFLFAYRYIQKSSTKNYLFFILATSSLLLSHNLTSLIFIPLLIVYLLISLRRKSLKILLPLFLSFTLSAFFTLPALLEKQFVTVSTMTEGYFNYVNHFATISQLFLSRFWGYGASLWGPVDDMSFSVGHLHWLIPIIALSASQILKKNIKLRHLLITFFFNSLLFLFLTHNRSTFIWQALPFMPYFQFPWRFLGPAVFGLSLVSASFITIFPKLLQKYFTAILIILVILFNIQYFHEDLWFANQTDAQILSPQNFLAQSGAGLRDYWPIYGQTYPKQRAPHLPEIVDGQATITGYERLSNQLFANIESSASATLVIPQVYFPGWSAYLDNSPLPISLEPELGLISLNVPSGHHRLILKLRNTPLRTLANLLSLVSVPIILYFSRRHESHS